MLLFLLFALLCPTTLVQAGRRARLCQAIIDRRAFFMDNILGQGVRLVHGQASATSPTLRQIFMVGREGEKTKYLYTVDGIFERLFDDVIKAALGKGLARGSFTAKDMMSLLAEDLGSCNFVGLHEKCERLQDVLYTVNGASDSLIEAVMGMLSVLDPVTLDYASLAYDHVRQLVGLTNFPSLGSIELQRHEANGLAPLAIEYAVNLRQATLYKELGWRDANVAVKAFTAFNRACSYTQLLFVANFPSVRGLITAQDWLPYFWAFGSIEAVYGQDVFNWEPFQLLRRSLAEGNLENLKADYGPHSNTKD